MSDRKENFGHVVENGLIRYFSVTGMERADRRSQGCPQKWHRRYVLRIKEPEDPRKEAQKAKGVARHSDMAAYLTTGTTAVDPLLAQVLHMLPPPGSPGLVLEKGFHTLETYDEQQPDGMWKLGLVRIRSPLTAAGIPFVGYVDLAHSHCINYGGDDVTAIHDPPGTVEVLDLKFKGKAYDRLKNPLWKRPEELIGTIQMAGYGEVVRRTMPDTKHIRLSHLNIFEKGSAPRKITKLHVVDDFPRAWEYVESLARLLVDVAREPDVNKVPANVQACDAFGGCPYREICDSYKSNSLDNLYNDAIAKRVAQDYGEQMGLLGSIPMQQPAPQMPQAQSPQMPAAYAAPPPAPPPTVDHRAQLAAEEAALRAAQPAQQALSQNDLIADAWNTINSHGRGLPAVTGAGAVALCRAFNVQHQENMPGTGALVSVTLTDPQHIFQIANELEEQAGRPARFPAAAPVPQAAPPPVTSPSAPTQVPQGYAPQPSQLPPVQTQMSPGPVNPAAGMFLPPGAPPSLPNLAAANPASLPATPPPAAEPEAPKRGRGRPKNPPADPNPHLASGTAPIAQTAAPTMPAGLPPSAPAGYTSVAAPQVAQPVVATQAVGAVPTSQPSSILRVFVGCRPEQSTTNLADYVEHVNAQLARMYCVDQQGRPTVQDVRAAPKDSLLGYGGWRGAVREVVMANPPPPGVYHLDIFGDDLRLVVAEALRVVCARNNGEYVMTIGGR